MKAADRYSNTRVKKACERLLSFTTQSSYRSILTILRNGQDQLPLDKPPEEKAVSETHSRGITRGVASFRKDKQTILLEGGRSQRRAAAENASMTAGRRRMHKMSPFVPAYYHPLTSLFPS